MTEAEAGAADDDSAAGRRIDGLLPQQWSSEVVEALDNWLQGHLIAGAPLCWVGPSGDDAVLGTEGAGVEWETIDAGLLRSGWMIVTSQTCDVAATGPGARHPFVDLSPVYRLPDDYPTDGRKAIANGEVTHLVRLTDPPGEGDYVADLRVTVLASKGLLLEHEPVDGWANEADRLGFAEHIAARTRRPALAEVISNDFTKALGAYIRNTNKRQPQWWERVEQVRLRVIGGDRLAPNALSLLVCCEVELTPEQCAEWRNFRSAAEAILSPAGIKLQPMLFMTLDELPARLYKESVPLRLPELKRPPNW